MKAYICPECKKPCSATRVDVGYGPDEFWGQIKHDVQVQPVSDCCHAVLEGFGFDEDSYEEIER